MPIIETEYQITVSDFRKASYYGLFLRYRRPFLILFIVIAGALVYALASALGMGPANPHVFFLAGAYAVWGLFMAAGTEKGIRAYLRSPDKFVGCTFHAVLDERQMHLAIPGAALTSARPGRTSPAPLSCMRSSCSTARRSTSGCCPSARSPRSRAPRCADCCAGS